MATQREKQKRARMIVSAERRLQEHVGAGSRLAFKLPKGVNSFNPKKVANYTLDIIPFVAGAGNPFADKGGPAYERTYFVHNYIGPGKENFLCLARNFKKPCAICEHANKLSAENPEPGAEMKKLISSLQPKERQLWNVFDHAAPDRGVQVWEVSYHNFGTFLEDKLERSKTDPVLFKRLKMFADPDNGRTLVIGASEKSQGPGSKPYLIFSDIEFRKRAEPLTDEVLEAAVCLDDLISLASAPGYKAMSAAFHQSAPEDDEEEETEDEDADTEEGEDEEGDESAVILDKGTEVIFTYKKKELAGTIIKVDRKNEMYHVEVEGREKPSIVGFADETLHINDPDVEDTDEDEEDAPPKKKPGKKKPPVDDDEEEEGEDDEDSSEANEEDDEADEEVEDDDEEEEDAKPAKKPGKKPITKPGNKKPPVDDDWDTDEEEEEADDDVEEEEEASEDDEDPFEDEDEEPAPKKPGKKKPGKK